MMMGRARKPAFWTALMGSVLSNEEAPLFVLSAFFYCFSFLHAIFVTRHAKNAAESASSGKVPRFLCFATHIREAT